MIKRNNDPEYNWIDISIPLTEGMVVAPGEITLKIERRYAMERGDRGNNSIIHMGVHTGTHIDAPRHHFIDGKPVDQMPLAASVGPVRVIEIDDTEAIKPGELKNHDIRPGERILFKTRNSQRCWQNGPFSPDYTYITKEAAVLLVSSGVRLVGIDYLSVGSQADSNITLPDTHKILLGAEIWIVEGLDLSCVNEGNYYIVCLPLKLMQTDGSPARVILRPT